MILQSRSTSLEMKKLHTLGGAIAVVYCVNSYSSCVMNKLVKSVDANEVFGEQCLKCFKSNN